MLVAAAHGKKICNGQVKEYYVIFSAAEPGEKAAENGAVIWKIEGEQPPTILYHIPRGAPGAYPDAWSGVEKWRTSAGLDEWDVLSEEDTLDLADKRPELFTVPEVYALRKQKPACKKVLQPTMG